MKKYLIIVVLSLVPSLVNATAVATASLSNFSFTFQGGLPIVDPSSFYGYVQSISTANYSDDSQLGLSVGYSVNITSAATDSASYAFSVANYSVGDSNSGFNSTAGAYYGSSSSSTSGYITINYLARTSLYITADALIVGSLSSGDDYAGSFVGMSISSSDSVTGANYFQESSLQLDSIKGSYSSSETLYLSYFSTKNQILRFEVGTRTSAFSVSAVPEPKRCSLLLLGFGLMWLVTHRRKFL